VGERGEGAEGEPGAARARRARFGPWRRELWAFLEVLALSGLAVAQPTFDLLGRNARLFIAWQADGVDLVLLAVVVVLAPALACWTVEVLVGLVAPRVRPAAHLVLLGGLAGLVVLEALKRHSDLGPALLVTLAVSAAVAVALLVARVAVLRSWLRVLAVAPIAFLVLFLVASPAYDTVLAPQPAVADVAVGAPARVVVVVLDEMPVESLLDGSGRVDAELFPSFAALAADATWYRNTTTVAPNTEAAVPAILSGEMPDDPDAVPVAPVHPRNLFTLLGDGYSMNVHEVITRLCPRDRCPVTREPVGVHPGFGGMVGDVSTIWEDFASPQRQPAPFGGLGAEDFAAFDSGTDFVRSLERAHGPRLDFLHVLLPHFPWHYLPGGEDYAAVPGPATGLDRGRWVDDAAARAGRMRHLLQVQAVDTLLGRIVARLRALDDYEDALLVVTADHGVAFRAGTPFRGVAPATYPSIMWTPLFVKAPGQAIGVVDDRPARSVDVLPTIADHLDVDLPWAVSGRSLLGTPRPAGPVPLLDWKSNAVHPAAGATALTFDGRAGFARVVRHRAAPPGPAALRVYRSGAFGALVGTGAYARAVLGAPIAATLDDPLRFQVVDHAARRAPWASIHGTIAASARGKPLAVVLNGTVAGIVATSGTPAGGRVEYSGMVVPSLLRAGRNLVQLFVVEGTPAAPVLRAATFTAP
jgi:hypothetical protein